MQARNNPLYQVGILLFFPLLALGVVTQFYVFVAVPEKIAAIFSWDYTHVSYLTTVFGLFYAFGFLFWGRLSDKLGRKPILLVGLTILLITTMLISVAEGYITLLALRGIQGFFASAFPPVGILWLSENLPQEKRILGIAFMSCAFLLAASFGQWLGTVFINDSLFSLMAILGSAYAISIALITALPSIKHQVLNAPVQSFWLQTMQLWKQNGLRKVYVMAACLLNSYIAFYASIAATLRPGLESAGIDVAFFHKIALPALFFSLLSPLIIRKFGTYRIVFVCCILLGCALAAIVLSLNAPGWWIYPAHIFFTLTIALAIPSLINFTSEATSQGLRGTATAFYMFFLFVGAGVGTLLPSYIGGVLLMVVYCLIFLALCAGFFIDMRRLRQTSILAATGVLFLFTFTLTSHGASMPTEDTLSQVTAYYQMLSPNEKDTYTKLLIVSGNKNSGAAGTHQTTLFRWQREPTLLLGQDHVTFQLNAQGRLAGLARMIPAAAKSPLPDKLQTEEIARSFLQEYAPDLLQAMNIQWIGKHDDEKYTDGQTQYRINGMKMKCRSTNDGTYFWVIVGADHTVIVFERDIEWDFIKAGRQTEKWLHDDWLKTKKITFSAPSIGVQ